MDFRVDAVHASGDTKVMKDEGAEANTTNSFTDEGQGYSLVLTATEMQAARVVVYVVDQTATKVWLDKSLVIETYGNAGAQHAVDLDDSVRAGLTSLPNAAADAAGGLPISDAGGLDLDTKLANTNEVTVARMGALTDWINGGRLDLLLDDVLARIPAALVSGRMDSDLGAKTGNVALSTQEKTDVNAEVVDVLETDTHVESASVPAATSSLKDAIVWLKTLARNKITQTSTTQSLRNDVDSADIATSTVSDDGTTATRGEWT